MGAAVALRTIPLLQAYCRSVLLCCCTHAKSPSGAASLMVDRLHAFAPCSSRGTACHVDTLPGDIDHPTCSAALLYVNIRPKTGTSTSAAEEARSTVGPSCSWCSSSRTASCAKACRATCTTWADAVSCTLRCAPELRTRSDVAPHAKQ